LFFLSCTSRLLFSIALYSPAIAHNEKKERTNTTTTTTTTRSHAEHATSTNRGSQGQLMGRK